ncbi:MAG: hypothetical protein KJZ74_15480 [Gemmatimonadales bacterium]|nr:hypothetical protein [Gemmatimonadota bacterium]MCL4215306.1 hypothetical protein [Gemmatimonadales bacterium]
MLRSLLAGAALCAVALASAHAQAPMPSRFAQSPVHRAIGATELTTELAWVLEAPQSRPPTAPVAGQLVAGFAGLTAGGALGMLATAGSLRAEDADERVLLGVLGGAIVGTVAGVHWYGRRHGLRSSIVATTLGATAGMLLVYAAPVTMPIGATVAYNIARRAR